MAGILVNKYFEVWSEDALEVGETDDKGEVWQDHELSFSELVSEMRNYSEVSSSPPIGSISEWMCNNVHHNYSTGEDTEYSLHYSRNNPARKAKYWKLAMKAAGFPVR